MWNNDFSYHKKINHSASKDDAKCKDDTYPNSNVKIITMFWFAPFNQSFDGCILKKKNTLVVFVPPVSIVQPIASGREKKKGEKDPTQKYI